MVAIVAADGTVIGEEARSVVRRDNLLHASTAVLVRDPDGRIYVHRRTDSKDWAPGRWDAAAGGVLKAGEDAAESAARELEEELGVTGVSLVPLGAHVYEDETVRCYEHVFEAVWEGPIRHQPEEVAEGGWMSIAELGALLEDPARPFVPDTRQLLGILGRRGVHDYASLG